MRYSATIHAQETKGMMCTLTPKSYSYTVRLLLHSLLVALFIGTTFADVEKKRLGSLRKDDLVVTDVTGGGGGGISKDEVIAIVTNNDTKVVMPREIDVAHKEARSMKPTRIGPYLWFMTSDGEDFAQATNRMSQAYHDYRPYGCSGICNSRYHGRNLDWYYNKQASVVVRAPAKDGKHGVLGIVCGAIDDAVLDKGEWDNRYASLPFCLGDGINDAGVTIQQNVVPRDPTKSSPWRSSSKGKIISFCIIRYVLDRCSTAREAADMICNLVYIPNDFAYDSHYMVSDATSSFIVEDGVVYESYDAPTDALTNFRIGTAVFNEDNTVNWATVEPYGQGLERYDLMRTSPYNLNTEDGIKSMMKDLWYTRAYETNTVPYWYTEHCDASTPELTVMAAKTNQALFAAQKISWKQDLDREHDKTNPDYRGGKTWQTVHTTIYDRDNLTMRLITQEDPTSERLFNLITDVPTSHDLTDVVTRETDSTGHATAVTVGSRCNVSGLKEWSNTNTYYQGDTVKHDGVAYVCTVDPQSFVPPTDHWTNQAPFWTAAAVGPSSFANGLTNVSSGIAAHAEGISTHAGNKAAHSDGLFTAASGLGAHAEGNSTLSCGSFTHAEGSFSRAIGMNSHAEGDTTTASGVSTHSEGRLSSADGLATHAEGNSTKADGIATHASGSFTTAGIRDRINIGGSSSDYGAAAQASGWGAVASSQTAFTWQGVGNEKDVLMAPTDDETYADHGAGTFNINPVGGIRGVYIGHTNVDEHIDNKIVDKVVPWALRNQPHPTGVVTDVRTNGVSVVYNNIADIYNPVKAIVASACVTNLGAVAEAAEAAAEKYLPLDGIIALANVTNKTGGAVTYSDVGALKNIKGMSVEEEEWTDTNGAKYTNLIITIENKLRDIGQQSKGTNDYSIYTMRLPVGTVGGNNEGDETSIALINDRVQTGQYNYTNATNGFGYFSIYDSFGQTEIFSDELVTNAGTDEPHVIRYPTESGTFAVVESTVPLVTDTDENKTAVTIGTRNGNVGKESLANGNSVEASGTYSHAEGNGTTASGLGAHSEGLAAVASGNFSFASGYGASATRQTSFVWQGIGTDEAVIDERTISILTNESRRSDNNYADHGAGTFNINPVGGIRGVYIGHTNVDEHIDNKIVDKVVPWALRNQPHPTGVVTDVRTNGVSVLTGSVADIDLSKYETKNEVQAKIGNVLEYVADTYKELQDDTYIYIEDGKTIDAIHQNKNGNIEVLYSPINIGTNQITNLPHIPTTYDYVPWYHMTEGDAGALIISSGGTYGEPYTFCIGSGISAYSPYSIAHGEDIHVSYDADYSHAEGQGTRVYSKYAHAEGISTFVGGLGAHSEGEGSDASGNSSHAEGRNTKADADHSHAEGHGSHVYYSATYGHAEGYYTQVGDLGSPASYISSGFASHAEGYYSYAMGAGAHAEGYLTHAGEADGGSTVGNYSHAEGVSSITKGEGSHAEGYGTAANGMYSHAEGCRTITGISGYPSYNEGVCAHASGWGAWASNNFCFVWQGNDSYTYDVPESKLYKDNGPGTFNINPVGGPDGFWIGTTNLTTLIERGGGSAINSLTNANSRAWSATATDNSIIKRIDNLEAEIVGVNALLETALGGNN